MSSQYKHVIQIGDWCFEIKSLRALKTKQYGEPYHAIAQCTINGDEMYIDGLLAKDEHQLGKKDWLAFKQLTEQLGLQGFKYHRVKDAQWQTKSSEDTSSITQPLKKQQIYDAAIVSKPKLVINK
jgi:hypothetical protein